MVKNLTGFILLLLAQQTVSAQSVDQVINATEVERIERTLSADDMRGRRIFTPDIDKAAAFIADEFKKAGLQPVTGTSYFQDFAMQRSRFVTASGQVNGKKIEENNIIGWTAQKELSVNDKSGYEKVVVKTKDTSSKLVTRLKSTGKNYVLVIDSAQRVAFETLKR